MKETIGERVKFLREKRGLTQRGLALKSDIANSTISRIEKNENVPYGKTLENIAKSLNVSADYILTGKNKDEIVNVEDTVVFKSKLHKEIFISINLLEEPYLFDLNGYVNGLLFRQQQNEERKIAK